MSLTLEEHEIRRVLPHRAPLLQLDRMVGCTDALDSLSARKALGGSDPMVMRCRSGAILAPVALIEGLAQCCGLLLRLRWLADHGVEIARFAAGDDTACRPADIPRSVLAESRAQFSSWLRPGCVIGFHVRLRLSRGGMHRFEGSAEADGAGEAVIADIMLNFPFSA